ncbi:MAG: acyl-CoA dehydrogenase [Rubrivivax sp.]|nr:acyl-CoA dehydrogenase [Rubrivivax sp.]
MPGARGNNSARRVVAAPPTPSEKPLPAVNDVHEALTYDAELNEAIGAFAQSAAALLASASPFQRLRDWRGQSPRFDRAMWSKIAEAGWPALLVPEAQGGLGLDLLHACAVLVEVGRHPVPEPVLAAAGHAPAILRELPASPLRDELLRQIASGERIVGVAWQESPGGAEDRMPAGTTAREAGRRVLLEGQKQWVVPARGADGWLVAAWSDEGPGWYWLPADDIGAGDVQELVRADGSSMGTLALRGVSVPPSHCLGVGDDAQRAMERGNDAARLLQAAELLGIAEQAFQLTLDYLDTRVQFGQAIGANQALQHRMVDGFVQLKLARAALRESLAEAATARALGRAASRAKARCAGAALHITRLAVQFHGAIGFTDECDVGFFFKRALQLNAWLGTASAHRLRWLDQSDRNGAADDAQSLGAREPEPARGDADWSRYSDAEFRAMVRGFIRRHYPEALRHPSRRLRWHEIKGWYFALGQQGWLAPAWPKEHGGMALPAEKMLAFIEEMEDWGVARMPDQGLINLGPILIRYGTPAQQQRYLPKILSGEHVWCQGYSEPNAGSDLASLRCEAVPDGDDFVVTGQKIWTTLAQDATHIFLLVRTNKAVKKQAGISFLLADIRSPGVTVRPIRNIAGEEEFCEVFFDRVRVPRANLVGEIDQGWTIAKALLGWERLFVGSPKTSQHALGLLRRAAADRGLLRDGAFRARLAELELDVADLRGCYAHYAEIVKRGEAIPASVSVLKIWATETYTRIAAQLVESCDEDGSAAGGPAGTERAPVHAMSPLMTATITTIYGGTNEIQRNILARQVLNLGA